MTEWIANEYIIEIPEFIDWLPPREELWDLRGELLSEDQRSWDGQTWYRTNDDPRFQNAIDKIDRTYVDEGTDITPYLTVKHEGLWMRPHIDNCPGRNVVLIYPIAPLDYDIVYVDKCEEGMEQLDTDFYHRPYEDSLPYEYDEVFRHTYRCPTFLNTKHPHAVEERRERKMLSFRVNFGDINWTFNDVKNHYLSGKMFHG
tara:strand:+ start:350 stop:952 length:603 start_codon:yes stop_codon:yes gene_type:complete